MAEDTTETTTTQERVLTVALDENGRIKKLPDELQTFVNHTVARERKEWIAKYGADPAERERAKTLEEENSRLREAEAVREKRWDDALKEQETRLSRQITEKDDAIKARDAELDRRTGRLKSMLGSEIRAAAVAAGAREESLPELVKLLGADVDLDADLNPIVKSADGKPLEKDGKPVSIEGFVTDYLASHPHHLKGSRGVPGRSIDGASFRRPAATIAEVQHEDALAAVASNPTTRTIAGAVRSIRQRASA
ncbi:MAG: hypothetical protein IT360_24710 [Gemmatimonadaceae bacterium]|nr:hypothetical protein [Gemmatimonadaceae bacterium]